MALNVLSQYTHALKIELTQAFETVIARFVGALPAFDT
jgi:hypothetical protein